MTHSFTVSAVIPATPKAIYDCWLTGRGHAQMTGTNSATASTKVGAKYTAWDGYIAGRNVALVPGKKIVQSWRTTEFSAADEDSQIAVTFAATARGTKVTLTHSNVPDSHQTYQSGWVDHYFEPMKVYFAAMAAKPKVKKKPAKAKAKAKPKRKPAKRALKRK